jgi:O-antigen biosynthesis protein WbqV
MSRTAKAIAPAGVTLIWVAKFGLHVALLFLGFVLAYEARLALPAEWWLTSPRAVRVLGWAAIFASIGAGTELVFQSERSAWRFSSMRDVLGLVRNVTITTSLFLILNFFIDRGTQLPRSVLPLAWLLSLALLVGIRIVWRLPHDHGLAGHFLPAWWPGKATDRTPTLIIGPMAAANRQIRMLQSDPDDRYQPIGVITPHANEVGLRLHGVPFIASLSTWVPAKFGLTTQGVVPHAIVFLADPVQVYGFSPERVGELRRAGHALLKPQNLEEIEGAPARTSRLQEIPLEDFLPRKPIALDGSVVRDLIAGRRVLVTGAGGSIGSELCRQLLALDCAHLSMLDHSEFQLFEIDRELADRGGVAKRRSILANVRDTDRIAEIVRTECPDIIFHAAALKHVGLVENNPTEAVLTNVLGTWNVIQAAAANNVDQFVLISTDKAVAPSNVMGATKRIAESLLDLAPQSLTRMTAVRFGNVLGSAGSVVPIFRDQIARGGPVTVTHPEVSRFFMTIPEAVQLVLHSAAIAKGARTAAPRKFLLEMGEPVKIADLARQMILLSGKSPDSEITISYCGLRAGEKLSEILLDADEKSRSCVDGVNEIISPRHGSKDSAMEEILSLIEAARSGGEHRTASMLNVVLAGAIGRPTTL